MSEKIRHALSLVDFQNLLLKREVALGPNVVLILSDIGFDMIQDAVDEAEAVARGAKTADG